MACLFVSLSPHKSVRKTVGGTPGLLGLLSGFGMSLHKLVWYEEAIFANPQTLYVKEFWRVHCDVVGQSILCAHCLDDECFPTSTNVYQPCIEAFYGRISWLLHRRRVTMNCGPNTKTIVRLRHEQHFSNGRNEAFSFALKCAANASMIMMEIEEAKQTIRERLRDNPHGSMAAGSSPRSYQDGYISGLSDALQIITDSAQS